MGFIRRIFDFLSRPSHSRTMGLLIALVLVTAISLTVIVSQQQQQLKQKAVDYCADTTIIECPPKMEISVGNTCASPNFKCKIDNYIYECK